MSVRSEPLPTEELTDGGCLPAWGVDDLPEPKPFTRRNLLALIGPGLVLAGGSIGTGEWVMGPQAAAKYHGAMMWVVIVSIMAQIVLNTEVMRYTLCTGEPIMTGFLRCPPGPKFWLAFYIILDVGGWMPALSSLGAQIIVVMINGLSPTDSIDPAMVNMVAYAVFAGSAALVLFGGKIYNMLQFVMGGKFLSMLAYLLLCCLFFVSAHTWAEMWGGLFNPFNVPRDSHGNPNIDWALISALAGYAGVGGLGNIMVSNFVREKGWGMGSKVGAIPSAFGGHQLCLSHLGTRCPPGAETKRRFKGWFKYLLADQYLVWGFGSLVGMMLPCMLGAQYLSSESLSAKEQWRWAAAMAQDFGAAHGGIFRFLTLLCGLVIMIPGQFYVVDNIARRWTDAIWSGSMRAHGLGEHRVKLIYYAFAGAYVVAGLGVLIFFPKLSGSQMMLILGSMANFAISCTIFHTIYVNRRFLPRDVRASHAKELAMVVSGLFFFTMFCLVVNQKILPIILAWFH